MAKTPIHVVTRFSGLDGCTTHAIALTGMLAQLAPTVLWADAPTPAAPKFGATPISPFAGQMPRGGNLVLLGTHLQLGMWLDHARPKRLILICVLSNPAQLFATLALLERPTLPPVELVFISSRLQAAMGIPGIIGPEPMDLTRFQPRLPSEDRPFTLGRHSRDTPEKHHPDDPSLYRMLGWAGCHIRLMGATCLTEALSEAPGVNIRPAGAVSPEVFLGELDCFFYRTNPVWAEPSGRVVMEALASGLPAIVHESGGYTDWIEQGSNGYVFSSQEEAFDLLSALKENPQHRRRMAVAARASAERLAGGKRMADYLDWLSA